MNRLLGFGKLKSLDLRNLINFDHFLRFSTSLGFCSRQTPRWPSRTVRQWRVRRFWRRRFRRRIWLWRRVRRWLTIRWRSRGRWRRRQPGGGDPWHPRRRLPHLLRGSWHLLLLRRTNRRRLLRWPRGRVPGLPHLRRGRHRWPHQVQLPLPQRHAVQPAVLCLRLVVQRRLLCGEHWTIFRWKIFLFHTYIQAQDLYYINDAFNEALAANTKP